MSAPAFEPVPADSPIDEDGPSDPGRSWRWRDHDDAPSEPPAGPFETEAQYRFAKRHFPALVTPIF